MSFENDLEKIIGNIWFVKNNFQSIISNAILMNRAKSIREIIKLMSCYDRQNTVFADKVVLDNYLGSMQRYITGYDLPSIHLSSKSLEMAFLLKVSNLQKGEKCGFLGDLCKIVLKRKLIIQNEDAIWRVVHRRNMSMHDAILEQAVIWISTEWIEQKLETVPKEYHKWTKRMLEPLMAIQREKLKQFDTLPDFRWYVRDTSFESTKKLIVVFFRRYN